ncbi:mucin-5AC-like isoform X3 [Daphnia pulex]|uniref:mucin-5AC-like isoform X3 n=1 Tax=Daphnia pulex TaxID=6669 RepID=UPI001EDFA1E2|nr:mucin-5AC-like isoform X3 [Daphnia pulex]
MDNSHFVCVLIGCLFLGSVVASSSDCSGIEEPNRFILCYTDSSINNLENDDLACRCSHLVVPSVVNITQNSTDFALNEEIVAYLKTISGSRNGGRMRRVLSLAVSARDFSADSSVHSIVGGVARMIDDLLIEGVEIHWQQPSTDENSKKDKANLVLFMKDLHAVLQEKVIVTNTPISTTHINSTIADDMEIDAMRPLILLRLPTSPEQLVKGFDLKPLARTVDLFVVSTHNIEDASNATYHHSRLMGISDILNTDSVLDLVTSLGVSSDRVVAAVPTFALQFLLRDAKQNLPGSQIAQGPTQISMEQLHSILKKGNWTIERDDDLTGTYAYSQDGDWIAFDDEMAAMIKAKYFLLRDIAGVAIMPGNIDEKPSQSETPVSPSMTQIYYEQFLNQESGNRTRRQLAKSLQDDLSSVATTLSSPLYNDRVRASPYRIVRIVARSGETSVVRQPLESSLQCSRQGYYRHPEDCGSFYRCVKFDQYVDDFTVFEYDCPEGLVFDEKWEVCTWPSQAAPCGGSSEIRPVPMNKFVCPGEGYFADPENCRWFFACRDYAKDGVTFTQYEFRCPFGLLFDEENLLCNWPWLVPQCSGGAVGSSSNANAVKLKQPLEKKPAAIPMGSPGYLSGKLVTGEGLYKDPRPTYYGESVVSSGCGDCQSAGLVVKEPSQGSYSGKQQTKVVLAIPAATIAGESNPVRIIVASPAYSGDQQYTTTTTTPSYSKAVKYEGGASTGSYQSQKYTDSLAVSGSSDPYGSYASAGNRETAVAINNAQLASYSQTDNKYGESGKVSGPVGPSKPDNSFSYKETSTYDKSTKDEVANTPYYLVKQPGNGEIRGPDRTVENGKYDSAHTSDGKYVPSPSYSAPAYSAPVYSAPAYSEPTYSAPAYSEPTYSAPAYTAPTYSAPAYSAPTYSAPAYSEPAKTAPTYSAPAYSEPTKTAPAYSEPTKTAPAYSAPVYSAPAYSAPAYSAPAYSAPAYSEPAKPAPAYSEPTKTAPAYSAPAYSAPAYSAPAYSEPAKTAPAYSEPTKTAPAYSTPAYSAPAYSAPAYTAPAYSAPAYSAPAYSEPAKTAPTYSAPAYSEPAKPPTYSEQTKSAPAYSEPTKTAPAYSAPAYSAPAYSAPAYSEPAKPAPAYSVPTKSAPAYSAPAYPAPTYSAPTYSSPTYTSSTYSAPEPSDQDYNPVYSAPADSSQSAPSYSPPAYSAPAYSESVREYKPLTTAAPVYSAPAYTEKAPEYKTSTTAAPVYSPSAPSYSSPVYSAPAYTEKAPEYDSSTTASTVYSAPAYSSPVYSAPAYSSPVYSAPAYSAPVYSAPAYTEKAPEYKTPTTTSPVYAAPAYSAPVYTAPAYTEKAPEYKTPTTTSPVYAAPAYSAPVYAAPAYSAPVYSAPANTEKSPEYKTPTTTSPVYSAPAYTEKAPGYKTSTTAAPVYSAPAYTAKVTEYKTSTTAAPVYSAPSYTEKSPEYKTPTTSTPVYSAPAYTTKAPEYKTPTTAAPVYSAPTYTEKTTGYKAPTTAAPVYSSAPAYSVPAYSKPTAPAYTEKTPGYKTSTTAAPVYSTLAYTEKTVEYKTPITSAPAYSPSVYTDKSPISVYDSTASDYRASNTKLPANTASASIDEYSPVYDAPESVYKTPTKVVVTMETEDQGKKGYRGTGGAAGSAGSRGTGGSAGSRGTGGSAGSQGTDGSAGSRGTGGSAGSRGTGGVGGTRGSKGAVKYSEPEYNPASVRPSAGSYDKNKSTHSTMSRYPSDYETTGQIGDDTFGLKDNSKSKGKYTGSRPLASKSPAANEKVIDTNKRIPNEYSSTNGKSRTQLERGAGSSTSGKTYATVGTTKYQDSDYKKPAGSASSESNSYTTTPHSVSVNYEKTKADSSTKGEISYGDKRVTVKVPSTNKAAILDKWATVSPVTETELALTEQKGSTGDYKSSPRQRIKGRLNVNSKNQQLTTSVAQPSVKLVDSSASSVSLALNKNDGKVSTGSSGSEYGHRYLEKITVAQATAKNETLGPEVCVRAGLFRHPSDCQKFYECYWDRWIHQYTVHIFKCPVHLVYDDYITACNWPLDGPACVPHEAVKLYPQLLSTV